MCDGQLARTAGKFLYAYNKLNGFALVTITSSEFSIQYKGVEGTGKLPSKYMKYYGRFLASLGYKVSMDAPKIVDLFEVIIKRQ